MLRHLSFLSLALGVVSCTSEPIARSRDAGTIDHIAFAVAALDDVPAATAQPPGAPYALRARRSALLTAPDGLLVEIIEDR